LWADVRIEATHLGEIINALGSPATSVNRQSDVNNDAIVIREL
jgi:hypothetical protein